MVGAGRSGAVAKLPSLPSGTLSALMLTARIVYLTVAVTAQPPHDQSKSIRQRHCPKLRWAWWSLV